jgi:hypothetical protein
MMTHFFNTHRDELIATAVLIIVLLGINIITTLLVKKIGTRSNINEARISLICRYVSVSLFLIGLLIEGSILGAKFEDIAVIFSSVFAILGIALFAVWSILSNVTSGIIMFFNFPYKIGDKIEIGAIDILDTFSFFEIDKNFEQKTLEAFSDNQPDFDGRSVNVEITKKERSGGGRRGGKKPFGKKDGGFGRRRSAENSSRRKSDDGGRKRSDRRSSDRPDRNSGDRKSGGFGRRRRER